MLAIRRLYPKLNIPFSHRCLSVTTRQSSVALNSLRNQLDVELEAIREAGLWKTERVITTKQGSNIGVENTEGKILNFCANNYLGLSSNPKVIQAGIEALDEFGAGLSSVRFICGTQTIHKKLEKQIAEFHKREDAILYASCFDANAGIFETLLSNEDAVLSDELNHASIIDGIRLCKANKYRFKHLDMVDLEEKLKDSQKFRNRLIVTDGVFSMDGDVAPLPAICDLADKYNALVFIDECHATGFLGKTGRGTDELLGVMSRVAIINSTLGKALGGAAGGYTTGPQQVIDLLRNRSRPFLFSNSLPPPVVACASKVFEMLSEDSSFVADIQNKTTHFREQMTKAGFKIAGDNHPICPIMLGDAKLAMNMADDLLKQGIFVIGFSYPVVAIGKSRIRVQISASHSMEDINRAINAFVAVGKSYKVIP
uniref:2-amino-3-ketobutyrate coenzyme A ligase, mitochondrial-like n=1 Tax=Ciona intestinalis TaxID=7719 RepID=F6Y4G4_CIOIN|nr:2-amino-3-ketobutyrate coenzyme A ligase, mitochondrial-like [Ciona intestinalis]|eukprot:XP_002130203.1 2-amino-3-ketobutyrate coenzyme A ligase, mitochondrial-like [Ciona intestinalis]